jgi:serine protease
MATLVLASVRSALLLVSCGILLTGCGGGGGGSNSNEAPDLSGSIEIETNTRVDLDTADDIRLSLSANNDLPENAQALPANAAVGGYLSYSGAFYSGSASQFRYYEDRVDSYTAELIPGDRITLQVFGSPSGFLETEIEDPTRRVRILEPGSGGFVDAIDPVSQVDNLAPITITLPDDFDPGPYLVEVSTSAGAPFRYVSSLADASTVTGLSAGYAEPEFVLDEAIVLMEPQAGSVAMAASAATAMGITGQKHLGGDAWLMQRSRSGNRALSSQAAQAERKATLDWVDTMAAQQGVRLAEPNYVYRSQLVEPNDDDLYDRQWALPFMQVPLAWQAAETSGAGVGIAVLDTGLFSATPESGGNWHPDLTANVRLLSGQTMDFVSGSLDIDREDDGLRDGNPADPGDGRTQSSNFHGTHVAGIAAAADNSEGIVGVAPEALIYPVRVLGKEGVGSAADLIDAIRWAAVQPDIDVLNLSLGGLGASTALGEAINLAYDGGRGKLIVAAAGNAATDEATFPAAYDNVVGVGAVDGAGVRAGYSNVGPSVDLVAPGGDAARDANQDGFPDVIISTWGTDEGGEFNSGYTALQGTSMAAPQVAGVYALMKGKVGEEMSPGRFMALLRDGALTRPAGPEVEYGAGLIDALAAMDAALEGNLPVTLSSSPSALQFNAAVTSVRLELNSFPEGESVTVGVPTPSAVWLDAEVEQPQSPSPSAAVLVSVNIEALDSGQRYVTQLDIPYQTDTETSKTLTVPVSLQLGTSEDEKDAGRHYVLLIGTEGENDDETVAQAVVTAENGRYDFVFDDVEPGDYFLVAGTDVDNNGLICENGEACAEYPVNGLPETISLGENPQTGVVLNTSFRRPSLSALELPRVGFEGYRVRPGPEGRDGNQSVKEYAP